MSNRLKLFRERMAAFEGAADPSAAIESGYYVHAPGKLLVDEISARIALRPSSSHLLLGGIGSGKTTQLLVACQQMNEIEDIHAIYVDVSQYTDIYKITSGVLTTIAGLKLAKILQDSEDENVQKSIREIHEIAYGHEEKILINLPFKTVKHKGIITEQSELYGINQRLLKTFVNLLKAASVKYGNIVFLLDGLDRLYDSKTFIQLVSTDVKAISSEGTGIVLVGPLTIIYGDYRDTVNEQLNYIGYQPFFDVENDSESYNFFKKIIEARTRTSKNFIEESAIQSLIYFSGGVLRDFINLIQSSIEETYLSGDDQVTEKQISKAVESFSISQLRGVSDTELSILEQTFTTETFIPRTEEDLRLLVRKLILEYRTPKLRYSVHPLIKPLLKQILVVKS
jgi:Cdc6-like AAA superfamily ATPase